MDRSYMFMGEQGLALAMDVTETNQDDLHLKFAIAFCNKKDQFNRREARNWLNNRLEDEADCGAERFTREVVFHGDKPRTNAMVPFANILRKHCQDEIVIHRTIQSDGEATGHDVIRGKLSFDKDNGAHVIRNNGNIITISIADVMAATTTGCRRNVDKVLSIFKTQPITDPVLV